MFVLIGGGGRTGSQLALHLLSQGHKVHIVEDRKDVLAHLHREIPTEAIFEGNPADPLTLERAEIATAQVVAACCLNDAQNLALCYVARAKYNVVRTIGCVNNPSNAWLYDKSFHVDVRLNRSEILASLIEEEMSFGDMMTLLKLRRGRISLVEMKIPDSSPVVGRMLQDIELPSNAVIAAVVRGREIIAPRGSTVFEVGDEVLSFVDAETAEALGALLGSHPKTDFRRWKEAGE